MWHTLPLYLLPLFFSPLSESSMCYHFCFALKKLARCLRSMSWTVLVRLKCVTLPRREHENQRLLNSEVSMLWPVTMEADASSYLPVATGLHTDSKSGSRLDFSSSPSELVCSSIGASHRAGHWSRLRLHGPGSSLDVTLALRLQAWDCGLRDVRDAELKRSPVWFRHCAFSFIDRMNIEPSVGACVKQIA